jgi:hypothetical protein
MLRFLGWRVGERKLRLWACACCRRAWHLLAAEASRELVAAAEQFADQRISTDEMLGALHDAEPRAFPDWNPFPGRLRSPADRVRAAAYHAGYRTSVPLHLVYHAQEAARQSALAAGEVPPVATIHDPELPPASRAERAAQCDLLRDIYLHPSREVHISPAVLRWNDATAVKLARRAYADRRLPAGTLDDTRLAMLADALEEAGCDDAAVLHHLRGGGDHYRGCWLVDVLAGSPAEARPAEPG